MLSIVLLFRFSGFEVELRLFTINDIINTLIDPFNHHRCPDLDCGATIMPQSPQSVTARRVLILYFFFFYCFFIIHYKVWCPMVDFIPVQC